MDKLINTNMKEDKKTIGAIVLATDQGLGYLARDFYNNGVIDICYVYQHSSRKNHHDWYDRTVGSIDELIEKSDIILMFETPFDWSVIPRARARGVKTVLMPMYECTPYPLRYNPDMILTPSDLDQEYYPTGKRINVPVPNETKWKLRERAKTFVHNAGNGGLGGRNGTHELLDAMKYVKSPIKLIVRTQSMELKSDDPRVEIVGSSVPFDELYTEGDVFIFPEKFNGLSLPIQEAFSSGMPIMCGDRFPMNTWLPKEILIPVKEYTKERLAVEFQCAQFEPKEIAQKIDDWYNKDISHLSLLGKKFKEENSWTKLKEKYRTLMCAL